LICWKLLENSVSSKSKSLYLIVSGTYSDKSILFVQSQVSMNFTMKRRLFLFFYFCVPPRLYWSYGEH